MIDKNKMDYIEKGADISETAMAIAVGLVILITIFITTMCHAMTFKEYINAPLPEKTQTKSELRAEWRNVLGWDAFSFVISLKDEQERLLGRTKITFWNIGGKLYIDDSYKKIQYVFKLKF